MRSLPRICGAIGGAAAALGCCSTASAHVKWFSDFSFADEPRSLRGAVSPLLLGMAALSLAVVLLLVWVEPRLAKAAWYRRVHDFLTSHRSSSTVVMRVTAGVMLMLAFATGTLFMPELRPVPAVVLWVELAAALLLTLDITARCGGVAMLVLFGVGVARFGVLHMADYVVVAGAAWFIIVRHAERPALRGTAIPALYITTGLSLCWVAMEKLIYPQWGMEVLRENPVLAMGIEAHFFLVAAAFIEFSLGYLMILGLLGRPLGAVVTGVLITTTMVFGRLEVVGHTLLHGALVVFLIEGNGTFYRPPIFIHRKPALRQLFAAVNFVLLLAAMLTFYSMMAEHEHKRAQRGTRNSERGTGEVRHAH
jgi:hypothetical protein